jgi:hypothetical protein
VTKGFEGGGGGVSPLMVSEWLTSDGGVDEIAVGCGRNTVFEGKSLSAKSGNEVDEVRSSVASVVWEENVSVVDDVIHIVLVVVVRGAELDEAPVVMDGDAGTE